MHKLTLALGILFLLVIVTPTLGQRKVEQPHDQSGVTVPEKSHARARKLGSEPRTVEPLSVDLNWLDRSAPPVNSGVSFGVPWPRGVVRKEQAFTLVSSDGKTFRCRPAVGLLAGRFNEVERVRYRGWSPKPKQRRRVQATGEFKLEQRACRPCCPGQAERHGL